MRFKTFLIFGAPGSGKGTQGRTLGTIPRFFHCACGDVFRALDTRTALGKRFLEYSTNGQLVPPEDTVQLWQATIDDAVSAHSFKPDIDFLVLDGIPRNLEQALVMEDMIEVVRVFHLSIGNEEELSSRLRKRALKDNRLDDANDEVIKKRLETYVHESRPLLEHYGPKLVRKIDANQVPFKVLFDILSVIQSEGLQIPKE